MPRTAKSTSKASKAASTQSTKPRPVASKPPARIRKPSQKAKDAEDSSSNDSKLKVIAAAWGNECSEKFIALIMEHTHIKRALFPPCGPNASTTKGGGKSKASAHFDLCKLLLADKEEYKDILNRADNSPKDKTALALKIKNRLQAMSRTTRDYITEMGETGTGINNAVQIDMTVCNAFTNKWEIRKECPWFFDMRNLIAQRPNLVPTGVGNSTTGVSNGVIIPLTHPCQSPDPEGMSMGQKRSLIEVEDDTGSGNNYEPSLPTALEPVPVDVEADTARIAGAGPVATAKCAKKRPAKVATSAPTDPVPTVAPKPSKKSKLVEFSEIAKSEEKSCQKELDLARLRMRQTMKTMEAKGRLAEKREDRKQEERMMKWKMKELKMRNTHKLRMACIGSGSLTTSQAASFFDGLSSSTSHHTSSEPTTDYTDYSDLDSFTGNATAGPSTSSSDAALGFNTFEEFTQPFAPGGVNGNA
ncbi:hypothetical protein DFH08DRAFT_938129 [Mycena albidolilacea]|uniref:No apical meristem-associated C-terminal domain-containing protein n=1 Tax=Mycena albidolilacea TaxID=1033008 RepID=A0AAD6ZW25_9AGAR|nr:hypothetical protein DFH08DRAFT_938129 [Mycena albidolilacea]